MYKSCRSHEIYYKNQPIFGIDYVENEFSREQVVKKIKTKKNKITDYM